jgi:hypothetical protein
VATDNTRPAAAAVILYEPAAAILRIELLVQEGDDQAEKTCSAKFLDKADDRNLRFLVRCFQRSIFLSFQPECDGLIVVANVRS